MLLYQLLLFIGLIGLIPGAFLRRRLPHRFWSMRLGNYPPDVITPLKGKQAIWIHAVSVGEVIAAQPLIEHFLLNHPQNPVVLSTITPGGFDVIKRRFGSRVTAIYFPLDFSWCVARAFEAFNPAILLLMEFEVWPMVVRRAGQRAVPVVVVNGRVSPKAFDRYRRVRRFFKATLREVDQWLMQSREDADRVIALGAPTDRVQVLGSLKWDASLGTRSQPEAVSQLLQRLKLDPKQVVVVAGSTHRGEEEAVLKAFSALRKQLPQACLIIAPRHLERVGEVERLIQQADLRASRLSQPNGHWDVGIVDSFGQLPAYYALATLVFIGGSLIPHGGQNPLEASSQGKPVVFGPFMHNFKGIAHQLLAHHAARQADNSQALSAVLCTLVQQPSEMAAMGEAARQLTERFQGATQRTVEAVTPWLSGQRSWPKGYG